MRKSNFERLKEARRVQNSNLILNSLDEFYGSLLGGPMLPTQKRFIYGPELCKAYKGPAGCAKSSTLAASAMGTALLVPGSKLFVSRADYNDLMDTTMGDMIAMLDKLPKGTLLDRDKSPPMKWWIKPAVVDGAPDDANVSQVTFMGLKDGLGSIQATRWYIDEADEVAEERAREILMRLRAKGDERDYSANFVFNPPSKSHWLYKACTGKDAQGLKVADPWMTLYEPLPRENVKNLPKDYYEKRAAHMSVEQRQRFIDGEWGATFPGLPVFREFRPELHVKRGLGYNPSSLLFRFWDFGYHHPVCLFAQLTPFGNLRVLKEVIGSAEEVGPFANKINAITASAFPKADVRDYGDPAVKQHKDTGSALAKLYEAGIQILYRTTKIEVGVSLIRKLLERQANGEQLLQFDDNCTVLIDAMKGGYHLDKLGEQPKKDGVYDHPVDALRYGIVNLFGGYSRNTEVSDLPDNLAYDPSEDR